VGGGLRAIDREKLVSANPTDIFAQTEAGRVPAALTEMAGRRGWQIHAHKIETIGDIRNAIADGRGGGVGEAMGVPVRAMELRGEFDRQLSAVAGATRQTTPRRVLLIVDGGPGGQIMACGVGTFLDQLLVQVNAFNALDGVEEGAEPMRGYPMLDLETVLQRAGALVVVISTKPADATGEPAGELMRKLSERAGDAFEVRVLRDEKALLPTTTLPRVAAKLAKVIHPDAADRIEAAMADAESPAPPPDEDPGAEPAGDHGDDAPTDAAS
jgi:ABC-type hemin transport system substrate-binding protein